MPGFTELSQRISSFLTGARVDVLAVVSGDTTVPNTPSEAKEILALGEERYDALWLTTSIDTITQEGGGERRNAYNLVDVFVFPQEDPFNTSEELTLQDVATQLNAAYAEFSQQLSEPGQAMSALDRILFGIDASPAFRSTLYQIMAEIGRGPLIFRGHRHFNLPMIAGSKLDDERHQATIVRMIFVPNRDYAEHFTSLAPKGSTHRGLNDYFTYLSIGIYDTNLAEYQRLRATQ